MTLAPTLTIHPDPGEPAGGYGFLELPDGSLGDGPVTVAVFESYGERWLGPSQGDGARIQVGDPRWQSERHEFGPYAVHHHEGADWVRIGPEIVNKIEEYTPLRICVGPHAVETTWPDDLPPRVGAAVLGGIQSTARTAANEDGAQLVGQVVAVPEPQPEPQPEPEPEPASKQDQVDPVQPPQQDAPEDAPGRGWLIPLLIVLLLLGAGLAAYFYLQKDQPAAPEIAETPVVADEPAPPAVVEVPVSDLPDHCSLSGLRGISGGFKATEQAIRTCGDALSPDTVLQVVEDASEQNDPDALLLFGTLYDGAQVDQRIEQVIGLSFGHDAARAAEYYARAKAAGSQAATTRLTATCAQLAGSNQTLAKGAYDDFCR